MKTTGTLLFSFKSKSVPHHRNTRTYVFRGVEYPEAIYIERRFVLPKEVPLDEGFKVLREGDKYRYVYSQFAFLETSLYKVFWGLENPSDEVFEIKDK